MDISDDFFLQIINEIEKYLQISTTFKIELHKILHVVHYKKGTKIQNNNQIPDQLWFLISGIAKEIAVNQTTLEEWVTWFWYPKDFLYTEPGLFNKVPADAHIELITDAWLIHISYSDCIALRETFHETSELIKVMRGKQAALRKAHQVDVATHTKKQIFDQQRKLHPELFVVARHKDILEFLGSNEDSFRRFI